MGDQMSFDDNEHEGKRLDEFKKGKRLEEIVICLRCESEHPLGARIAVVHLETAGESISLVSWIGGYMHVCPECKGAFYVEKVRLAMAIHKIEMARTRYMQKVGLAI